MRGLRLHEIDETPLEGRRKKDSKKENRKNKKRKEGKEKIRYNSSCKELYERFKSRGKPSKVALLAVINKLLRQSFAVVMSNTDYIDNYTC